MIHSQFRGLTGGRLFITGHTGFKGSWLGLLARELGIPTIGFALAPTENSLFRSLQTASVDESIIGDIRNTEELTKAVTSSGATTLVHLAAQPLVLDSYKRPFETFETNVMGTHNVLEVASRTPSIKTILVITTDKVYRNDNLGRRFIEDDPLEGSDPYSSSKVGAEAVTKAWQRINETTRGPKVIVARAGNVIGGGDLSKDRLIPDLIRGSVSGKAVGIRNRDATRPWQHVLDPLMGYLMYLERSLFERVPRALNFGPLENSLSVAELLDISKKYFQVELRFEPRNEEMKEAIYLDLDSTLAKGSILWSPKWNQETAIEKTFDWWDKVLSKNRSQMEMCKEDIHLYLN